MKKLLKKFYAAHVSEREDLKIFIAALFLIALALAILTYDVITVATGTADFNRHLPFIFAGGIGAIGLIVLRVLRLS